MNGGYDHPAPTPPWSRGDADLVAFGRPFIANPNLVARLEHGTPLAEPNPATFCMPGREGYVDHPMREGAGG